MSASAQPKSILKKPKSVPQSAEAGPSRPSPQHASNVEGKKGSMTLSARNVSANGQHKGKHVPRTTSSGETSRVKSKGKRAVEESDSEDDMDGDEEVSDDQGDEGSDEEGGTDDEIERAKAGKKSSKGTKRKTPTTAETFGSTLTSLLTESTTKSSKKSKRTHTPVEGESTKSTVPQKARVASSAASTGAPILALSNTKLPPSRSALSLERRAARQLKAQKEEKEDRARIRDVVEGWGPSTEGVLGGMEFEKSLRKVAQRGVIKLFNAILVASKQSEESGGGSMADKAGLKEMGPKKREKDNVLGRGGKVESGKGLTSESFLDIVRRG